jgi:hypothetical protein
MGKDYLQKGDNDSQSIELTTLGHSFFVPPAIPGRTQGDVSMKESYCGLCDRCPLDNLDFLKALTQVKNYVNQLPLYWWAHCFPGNEGFSLPEFFKGLEWFLSQPECPGCKMGGGLKGCPIRDCAQERQITQCSICPDQEICERFRIIMKGYSNQRIPLHHYSIRIGSMIGLAKESRKNILRSHRQTR